MKKLFQWALAAALICDVRGQSLWQAFLDVREPSL
jgi:hypothetical protein